MHLMKSHLAHAAAATLKNHSNRAFSAPFSAALFFLQQGLPHAPHQALYHRIERCWNHQVVCAE